MNKPDAKLSYDQREHLGPAIAKIAEGYGELYERLIDLGWEEGDFSCTQCTCESFQPRPPERPPSLICARSTCGHRFPRHRVF
jgi:hypothetical protein